MSANQLGGLPILVTDLVYHVGSLDQTKKGHSYRRSLEGHCLSVSHCPSAWVKIARLGGLPCHQLEKVDGVFLDVLRTRGDRALHSQIQDWGIQQGLCNLETQWKSWSTDEEGDWRYTLHKSEHEAQEEAESNYADEGPNGPAHEPAEVLAASAKLLSLTHQTSMDGEDCFNLLCAVWADQTQPKIDGVWWTEVFDPGNLSAPRGGIFPSRLNGWSSREVSMNQIAEIEAADDCDENSFWKKATEKPKDESAKTRPRMRP